MRKALLIAALVPVTLLLGGGLVLAQQQSPPADSSQQTAPDTPQPPQKKAAQPAPAKPSVQKPAPHTSTDDNAFPEDVSRKAAEAAGNAPDQGKSSSPSPAAKSSSVSHSATDPNAFPEDVSRKAAQAQEKQEKHVPVPPDESSSQVSSLTGNLEDHSADSSGVANPARAKKDIEVGGFYMDQGDYKGAYLRYQDAMKSDPGNVDAIFDAAEAARRLGNLSEAARNYQMYLEIVPNGSKAKRALKALDALPAKN